MKEKRFLPTNDLLFKKMLGDDYVAIGFINTLFRASVIEIVHVVPYDVVQLRRNYADKKLSRTEVDFICGSSANEKFIVELQVLKEENFDMRALYYLCTKFCDGYSKEGNKYKGLKPVRMMCLTGFTIFSNTNDSFHKYAMKDMKGRYLFNKPTFELGVFEYCKENVPDNLKQIAEFLRSGKVELNYPSFLKRAAEIVRLENLDEKEREAMQMYETLEEKMEEAKEFGKKEGIKLVKELISKGYTFEQAAELALQSE
ncbi:MAG: PD-(D/E)XK nuclease family transposase [Endomicrobium sp.]|nr:PD-(D/E)XK nuclease family transposase [Endomicrobium sp.]